MIRTPDQRLRVFVSSTLGELADERQAVSRAIAALHLAPVRFELGARPHPPRELYRAYREQSEIFIGMYWERYGQVVPAWTSGAWRTSSSCREACRACCTSTSPRPIANRASRT